MFANHVCVIVYLFVRFCDCEGSADDPKIISSNGDLTIQTASHKNISFETDKECVFLINGADFANGYSMMKKADIAMDYYKNILQTSTVRITRYWRLLIYMENGIIQRLNKLEAITKTLSHSTFNQNLMETLRTEISTLRSSVTTLNRMLTKNDCLSSPCKNGGTCQDLFGGVYCNCASGWEGPTCAQDIDECARFNSTDLGCQNGGVCINKPGTFECICVNGWYGLHCTRKTTDCSSGSVAEICGHGTCISQNNSPGYKCLCNQGWKKSNDGLACTQDVDECKEENPMCSKDPPVSCENTPGSFRCGACPTGYTGNGIYCADVNECELFNGGCSMNPMVECINTPGSKRCGPCPPGYVGNGVTCTFEGLCRSRNGNCHPLATCHDFSGSSTYVECRCPAGYSGNGIGPMGCLPAKSPCNPNPCNNGRCVPRSDEIEGYICRCIGNSYGKHCELQDGLCSSNPCQNGGTCMGNTTLYVCQCPPGFIGHDCNIVRQECGGDFGLMEEGTINYTTGYFSGVRDCSWLIQTEVDKILNITFQTFNVGDDDCTSSWLQILDRKTKHDSSLGKFCGDELPNGVLTTTNNVVINLKQKNEQPYFQLKWKSLKPQCYEFLNLSRGFNDTIVSPGWPKNYPNNRDCFWYMQAPLGKLISFSFYSLNIGNDTNCAGDFIEIASSFTEGLDVLASICKEPPHASLISSGPEVLIHFHSDEKDTYPGFQMRYSLHNAPLGCGKVFESSSGQISSPTSWVTSTPMCFYQIQHKAELKTQLTFTELSVKDSPGCTEDYVALYEGHNTSCPLIGRYCGDKIPATYISNSNTILIKFKRSDSSSRFTLTYEAVCGATFEAPSGIIQSEGYPNSYPTGLSCVYLIKQPPGTTISLEIEDLEFEYDADYYDDCSYDYLEVRDGDNENSTLIETFCSEPESDPIISSGNSLRLKFVTDTSDSGRGFSAKYKTLDAGCGGVRTNKTGFILFGDDDSLVGKSKCRWILRAPPGFVIQISWATFKIYSSYSCSLDSVSVYENNAYSKNSTNIGTYCGSKLPPVLLTSSNIATISLVIRTSSRNQAFSMHYAFLNETTVCGGNYFTTTGVIRSPYYPQKYPSRSDCTWTINVPPNQQISLNATIFKVGGSIGNCDHDFVEIRNGGSPHSPLIGRFCRTNVPKMIHSHTNQLYIHLLSRQYIAANSKFMFTWTTTTSGCGGTVASVVGAIASPNYPEPYSRLTECFWKILVNQGSVIQLILLDIDLESKRIRGECSLDYVQIFDGPSKLSKSLGKFCASPYPSILKSSKSQVDVYFRSDLSFEGRGFNIQYRQVCSNNLTGFGGVIESPNFPEAYPFIQDCYWNITVSRNNRINITFSHFDLTERRAYLMYPYHATTDPYINLNYLEIKYMSHDDEYDTKYVLVGKYANSTIPDLISVPADNAQIHFRSDTNILGNGFRLEWIIDGCGGHLKKPINLTSPNYPNKYPADIECDWLIEAPIGYSIQITFDYVNVERAEDCMFDGIQIFNGPDNTYPRLGLLCHIDKPVKYTSNGHLMNVKFISDSSYSGKGFIASFSYIKSKCGGTMTGISGTISSPNYPKNFDRGDNCEWLITTDENHVIEFEFEDLDLMPTPKCASNYVKIYDGPSTEVPLLASVCRSAPNETYTSTTNQMLVVFKATGYITTLGFKANYFKACGARIKAGETSGNLKSHPFSLPTYERNPNCSWTIIAPNPDQHVSLTITHLAKDGAYDYGDLTLSIYDGESSTSPLVGDYRDSKLPPTIVSNGVALHIVVNRNMDFFATYDVFGASCGGTLTGRSGMFSSPSYPKSYPFDTACEWTIQLPPGNEVSMSFQNFDVPYSEKCNMDFLEVRQTNATGKLVGIFCGNRKPSNITNLGSLWIYFKTSKADNNSVISTTSKGFLAEYTMANDVEVTGYFGEIASPLYPQSISGSSSLTWKITGKLRGSRILLEFKDFYTDSYDENDCSNSYVMVYDGPDNNSPALGMFCGHLKPPPIESTSNSLFIESDLNSPRFQSKFFLKWKQIYYPKKKQQVACGSNGIIDISEIHQYNLTSPGYPNGYGPRLKCEWTFQTVSKNTLRINFTDVSLAAVDPSCYSDFVEVYSEKNLVKKVCVNTNRNILYNTSNVMKIVFTTNSFYNGSGFAAIISEGCGGLMKESSGVIHFDEHSPRDWQCKWTINVKAGRRIEVQFLEYSSLNNEGCTSFILMKNGLDANSPDLSDGKFCKKPPTLQSTGNNLYLEFNGNPNKTKFRFSYKEIRYDCGDSLTLSNDDNPYVVINSPNFPLRSEPFIECAWVIRSPPGTYIQLDFHNKFDFHQSRECSTEGVELRNGGTHISPLIGKFCKNIPDTQVSSDNIMFVKFFTEERTPGDGFQANISIGSCGGTYRGESGAINWNWDGKLHHIDKNCNWNIIAPSYASLNIEITLKGLRWISYHCGTNGRFAIYEVEKTPPFNERLLDQMCDSRLKKKITSLSNHVIIKFNDTMKAYAYPSPFSIAIVYNVTKTECSYKRNADFGTIESPGYPSLNYLKAFCSWTIQVREGRRITLNITDFDLESYSSSTREFGQSIIFYDYDQFFIDELYYNSTKRVVKSSGNKLQVYFLCMQSSNHRGFSASYTSDEETVCNEDFSGDSGKISGNYNENRYVCLYKHTQTPPLNRTLVLTIQSSLVYDTARKNRSFIRVEADPYQDYVFGETIYSINRPTSQPAIVRTAFTEVFIVLSIKLKDTNFTIDYEHYPCGGEILGETGYISTPGYPNKHKSRLECAWVMKFPEEHQIKLNFISFNLGDDCEKSFMLIYNGGYPSSPRIGKFCNTNKPETIISQKNSLFIEYHYEKNSTAIGFNATYEPVIKGCGGTFSDKYRVIETPNYPKDYPNNVECRWNIVSPEGTFIQLNPIGRFHLEDTDGCKNDYVEVFGWADEKWKSIGKWCGRNFRTVISASNKMMIIFRSNDKISANGFQAKWQTKCGGMVPATRDMKYIISPGYPFHYDDNLYCRYTIYSREVFNVEFEDFELEGEYPTCINDNVTISSSSDYIYGGYRQEVYCGTTKPKKISSRFLTITFRSDVFVTHRGFKLSFKVDGCGEAITTPRTLSVNSATIKSIQTRNYMTTPNLPYRPLPFRSNFVYTPSYQENCLWNITAPKNKVVLLKFVNFSSTYTGSCYFNALEVYDGSKLNYQDILVKLCGRIDTEVPVITSKSNSALLYLKRFSINNNQPSFIVDILFSPGPAEGCGGTFNITRPMVIKPPKNVFNVDCQWKFMVPEDYRVEFKFRSLKIPTTCDEVRLHGPKNCSCSFIEMRDGSGPFSKLMDQLCGKASNYSQVYLTSWKLGFFRFYTNGNSTDAFEVTVDSVKNMCGPHLLVATREIQTLTSPGFPRTYDANIECLWTISKKSFMQTLVMRFVEFDLTNHTGHITENSCSGDRLEIDEMDRNVVYKGTGNQISRERQTNLGHYHLMSDFKEVLEYCGKETVPFDIFSRSYTINIGFVSTSEVGKGKGFKLQYFLSGCDYNYTQAYGRIMLQGNNTSCSVYITTPENTTISLYFNQFWLYNRNNCSVGSLEIFDGHSTNSPKLVRHCSYLNPNSVYSSSNKMFIKLSTLTTHVNMFSRVDLTFISTTEGKGCGGKIFDRTGSITSPMYPGNYTSDRLCVWEINVPVGAQVAVSFSRLDITAPCDISYLKVATYRGGKSNERTFCRSDYISTLLSDNKITVTYKSSIQNTGKGWRLQFKTVGSQYTMESNERRTVPPTRIYPMRILPRHG